MRRWPRGALVVLLWLAAGPAGLAAEAAAPPGDTLTQILDELRALRRSLERTAALQLEAQLAGERLRAREPQVQALAEQAGHLEQAQAADAVELERTQAELARVEEQLGQETAADAQRDLGAQRAALVGSIARLTRQEQEHHRRGDALAERLLAERAEMDRLAETLADVERRLDAHVRASDPDRAAGGGGGAAPR